jgi:Fic family protein
MPGRLIAQVWQHAPHIHAPARYKRACRYEAFLPDLLANIAPSLPGEVGGVVSEAELAIRALNDAARPALRPLARLLLRTEAIASSRIEGMQLGARELARAEARMESGGKVGPTARDVLANMSAMEVAIQEAALAAPFTVDRILAVHRRLLEGSDTPRIAGHLRTQQNWIGGNDYNPCGADFVPPPPEEVVPLLADLCQAVNADVLSPLVQAALIHAQFETIHPFDDGNGRTGRALIHVVLRRRGLAPAYVPPISVVLARGRGRYISGLASFRGDQVTDWVEYFAAATAEAARLAHAYVRAVEALVVRWRDQLAASPAAPRAGAAAWAIIDVLPAHPMITAPVAAAVTGRAKAAIYQGIKGLEQAHVLRPLSTGKRHQSWEASGLFDLLMALESGELPG